MGNISVIFSHWRAALLRFQQLFYRLRKTTPYFLPKVFLAFVAVNLLCYWWALLTTYPGLLLGDKTKEYVLMGFPVAALGASFDILSLFITLLLIRRALSAKSNLSYVGFLSVDLFIAVLATFWVLFAFMVSGWIVSFVLQVPETLSERTNLYRWRLADALKNPFDPDNLRNIYFGVVMGASALAPTLFHLAMAGRSLARTISDVIRLKRGRSA